MDYEDAYEGYYRFGMSLQSLPEDIQDEIFSYEYRSHFHLSVQEFEQEPWEAVAQARLIWGYQAKKQQDDANKSSRNYPDD